MSCSGFILFYRHGHLFYEAAYSLCPYDISQLAGIRQRYLSVHEKVRVQPFSVNQTIRSEISRKSLRLRSLIEI